MELVPIKVKIGTRGDNGQAKYPDFNQIDDSIRKGLDWSKYVDVYGLGWHYDKSCGHKEVRDESDLEWDSPFGQQWGVLVIPEDFAAAAISLFPDEIKALDETQLQDFYDNKAHAHEPEEIVDTLVLEILNAKKSAGIDVLTEEAKAMDPDDPTPGLKRNNRKRWGDFKVKLGVTIKDITKG